MLQGSIRFPQLRRTALLALILAFGVGIVLIAYGIALGLRVADAIDQTPWQFGIPNIATGCLALAVAILLGCLLDLIGKQESHAYRMHDALMDIKGHLEEQGRQIKLLTENSQLSDAARSIAHRDREQAVLRQAINEDILREDWEAAYYLVDQLERRFGYKLEASQLRSEIDNSRSSLVSRKIDEAVDGVRNLIANHDWDRARHAMEQLVKRFPNHAAVRGLPQDFENRRAEHKRRLMKEWDLAVQRDEVDKGIQILKQLDPYLSADEATALREAARDVFKKRLSELGVQFSIAVTERQWEKAMRIGNTIMNEFPNSRMATEVRDRYRVLEQRAERTQSMGPPQA